MHALIEVGHSHPTSQSGWWEHLNYTGSNQSCTFAPSCHTWVGGGDALNYAFSNWSCTLVLSPYPLGGENILFLHSPWAPRSTLIKWMKLSPLYPSTLLPCLTHLCGLYPDTKSQPLMPLYPCAFPPLTLGVRPDALALLCPCSWVQGLTPHVSLWLSC